MGIMFDQVLTNLCIYIYIFFKADLTHSQQLINFVAKIDENQENVKKKEQVG